MSASGATEAAPRRRSIRGRLFVAFAVQMGLLGFGCLVFLWTQLQLRDSRAWTNHTYEVIAVIEQVEAATFRQVSALRAYAITGYQDYLDQQFSGRKDYSSLVARLQGLTRDNASQQVRAAQVVALLRDWRDRVVDPALQMRNEGRAREEIAALLTSREAEVILSQGMSLLDDMLAVERDLLEKRAGRTERMADRMMALIVALMLVGLTTAAWFMRSVQREIGLPLMRLSRLAPMVASGEGGDIPHLRRDDEIGELAQSLANMREAAAEQARRVWVRERASDLIRRLQSSENEARFGEVLLERLCEALGAGYGLAYRWDERQHALAWCAGYGVSDATARARRFAPGEGLPGQSLVEQRSIELEKVPEGYLKVVSGLGSALPERLLFLPLVARGAVVAVLELALASPLTRAQREFLEEVGVTVALAWDALARALHTRELLQASQAQAEELQASEEALRVQQEQMRTVNETLTSRTRQLEAQSRQLRSSEENLRAQAEELRVSNAALEEKSEALRARQAELESARAATEEKARELEQASRYKSEFLANMSHELRTPLNSMLILSRTLADNLDEHLDADEVESATIIHDSGQSLLQLINDILDLSKVEAGKLEFHWEDVDLREQVEQLERRFRPVAENKSLDFKVEVADGLPASIQTDAKRLVQVLTNLLSNAFKFTERGAVALRAEAVEDGVALHVADSGIGIARDKLRRVFEAFEQAETHTSRRFGGTGLGLSIVKSMVSHLGGVVRVASEEGKGSTFSVVLPLRHDDRLSGEDRGAAPLLPAASVGEATKQPVAAVPSPAEPTPIRPSTEAGSARDSEPVVLVVDDDLDFGRVLCDIARRRGMSAVHAADGAQARAALARHQLIAVLLDIGLPDVDGWTLLREIKADPAHRDVPVHVVSGRDEAHLGRERGADSFMQKPVMREQVLLALDQAGAPAHAVQRQLLLVEPAGAGRDELAELLAQAQVSISTADNAEAALAQLDTTRYDALIVAPDLPDMPASEFLEHAADQSRLPPTVVYARRALSRDENQALREHAGSVVIEGKRSRERLLDEVNLFLHAIDRPPGGERRAVQRSESTSVRDLAGKTVLVVDDDMRNVFALSKALRAHGLKVVMAQDGHKALVQLEQRSDIDLVLMDIMMLGMDGYDTTRRIRANPAWKDLAIIAVTAKAMSGDREKCLEAGANDYCPKPIDMDRLLSQIQVWV